MMLLKALREHPYMVLREENFASLRINWNDKISNMREIAEELNIGLDSIVYFDDDPINREIMTMALAGSPYNGSSKRSIVVYAHTLMRLNDFNVLKITEEDAKRAKCIYNREKN